MQGSYVAPGHSPVSCRKPWCGFPSTWFSPINRTSGRRTEPCPAQHRRDSWLRFAWATDPWLQAVEEATRTFVTCLPGLGVSLIAVLQAGEEATRKLVAWLSGLGVSLIAADELRHETFQKDREQTGLPAGAVKEVMSIALEATQPQFFMARLHRRHGTTDRLLPMDEIQVGPTPPLAPAPFLLPAPPFVAPALAPTRRM